MELYLILHYIFFITIIGVVFLTKNRVNEWIALFISAFDSIPIFYFGNSASGGFFISDIVLLVLVISFLFNRKKHITEVNIKLIPISIIFIFWIIGCGVISTLKPIPVHTIYTADSYLTFTLYGIARLLSYLLYLFIFMNYVIPVNQKSELLKKLFIISLVFCGLLLLNQMGVLNLSGISGLGSRIQQNMQVLNQDLSEDIFLGTNKANLGAICYTIFWLYIYYVFGNKKMNGIYIISFVLVTIALLGTDSRSDIIGLFASIITFFIFTGKRIRGTLGRIITIITYFLIMSFLIAILVNKPIFGDRFDYYIGSILNLQAGVGSGGYRILLHESILNFLSLHPFELILGLGPNCFRMLFGFENIVTNFGHNTYLHNLVELGLIGIIILVLLISTLLKSLKKVVFKYGENSKFAYACIISFMVGRMITGISVDTFFAVDTMLTSNIMWIGYLSLICITTVNRNSKGQKYLND